MSCKEKGQAHLGEHKLNIYHFSPFGHGCASQKIPFATESTRRKTEEHLRLGERQAQFDAETGCF